MLYCVSVFVISPTKGDGDKEMKAFKLAFKGDFSPFSFFKRWLAKEFITYGSRIAAINAKEGMPSETKIEKLDNVTAIAIRAGRLAVASVVTDEYKNTVAVKLCQMILREFQTEHKNLKNYYLTEKDLDLPFPFLEKNFESFKDDKNVDKLEVLNQNVEELKDNVHNIIQKTIVRGEQLNELVAKSDQLSNTAKQFYMTAKKKNDGCCTIN
eukprot:GAHX01000391.1.p1 GENE.GAHX01000391.1~~GAHX01000391.1.p1  ORF type:complete len:211 (+),score=38.17 GAHX01000391.1:39-671(+)